MPAQLVNPAATSDAGSVPEETKWLDYPLVLLETNLPKAAWEPLSEYLPTSLDARVSSLMLLAQGKLEAYGILAMWSSLYTDVLFSKLNSLKTLDKDQAMEWATAQFTFLMSLLTTNMENFQEKAKGPAMEYWELLNTHVNVKELYASAVLSFGVLKQYVLSFLTNLWEQLEDALAGCFANERVVACKKELTKLGSNSKWAEITAWVGFTGSQAWGFTEEKSLPFLPSSIPLARRKLHKH